MWPNSHFYEREQFNENDNDSFFHIEYPRYFVLNCNAGCENCIGRYAGMLFKMYF